MNVFMLDHDPLLAAKYHCDKHVVKMVVETAQMLSTAWHELDNGNYQPLPSNPKDDRLTPWIRLHCLPSSTGREQPPVSRKADAPGEQVSAWWMLHGQRVYARTHSQHPSALWVQSLGGNYAWAWRLGMGLANEYRRRFGRTHATEAVLWALEPVPYTLLDTAGEWSEAPPVMPEECKVQVKGYYDSVASYRNYYLTAKADLLHWTGQSPPPWTKGVKLTQ
jgi:hypothetical protein